VSNEKHQESEQATLDGTCAVPVHIRSLAAALSCLAAAWIVAGSTGLLAHPLRRILTLVALGAALVLHSPFIKQSKAQLFSMTVVVCLSAWLVTSSLPSVNIAGVIVALVFLALTCSGPAQDVLAISCVSVTVFGIYRAAIISIPWFWTMTDMVGRTFGNVAGLITGRSLQIGATFAGLDFLLLTGTLWGIWLALSPRPRLVRAFYGCIAIVGLHLCYLIVLSYSPDVLTALPKPGGHHHWSWVGLLHKAVPWNLPALACLLHLLVAAATFRWATWIPTPRQPRDNSRCHGLRLIAFACACLLPAVTGLYPRRLSLEGEKIVFYDKTYVNWLKPSHDSYGRLSEGMCGMLPSFVESMGASVLVSAEITENDLHDADLLVLIYPAEPWAGIQLDRIWQFVRQGGSLLVMGEHTIQDSNDSNRSNEALKPTAMRVLFDSAMFAVMGWAHSYEALVHPTTAGISDGHHPFGVSIGASLTAEWPSNPVLVGRWGWADIGDEGNSAGKLGNWRYDSGEKLGDLVLAAEQRVGHGRVITFGDTSSLMNTALVNAHMFVARLLAYLRGDEYKAHSWWRQILGLSLIIVLVGLLTRRADALMAGFVALGLAGSLTACTVVNHRVGTLLPDGSTQTPNNLAYIDASHVEAYCDYYWRPNDVGGFVLTLMRNGYLPFSLRELNSESLQQAALLISIAPSRAFSNSECSVVRNFVTQGGVFIITVGYDESAASASILAEFGFAIGSDWATASEPDPMGRFKSPYLRSGDKYAHVRFHAAWPVVCEDPNAQVIANGRNNLPVIVMRHIGQGKVVVIGDTRFVMNENLEREDGQLIEGKRENADFWRWFIRQLRDQEMWIPPLLRDSSPAKTDRPVRAQTKQEVQL